MIVDFGAGRKFNIPIDSSFGIQRYVGEIELELSITIGSGSQFDTTLWNPNTVN
jgi:hypothetical protein